MTDSDYPSRMERGAEATSAESPADFYASIVAIWPQARTRPEQDALVSASQRMAFSHCTAAEQAVIVALRQRAGIITS